MKKITITMATIAMLMTACTTNLSIEPVKAPTASNSSQNSTAQNTTTQNTQQNISVSDEILAGKWQQFNTAMRGDDNKPPVLQFENGNIRLTNGCNNLWIDYRVANGQLIVSDSVRSTRMACDEKLMQIDSHISSLLQHGKFSLVQMQDKLILQIEKDNAVYWFIKE